jgi:hypothetical protein
VKLGTMKCSKTKVYFYGKTYGTFNSGKFAAGIFRRMQEQFLTVLTVKYCKSIALPQLLMIGNFNVSVIVKKLYQALCLC